jgi:hypothetical protein
MHNAKEIAARRASGQRTVPRATSVNLYALAEGRSQLLKGIFADCEPFGQVSRLCRDRASQPGHRHRLQPSGLPRNQQRVLRPLPYPQADRLVALPMEAPGGAGPTSVSSGLPEPKEAHTLMLSDGPLAAAVWCSSRV